MALFFAIYRRNRWGAEIFSIAFIVDFYAPYMGYMSNFLPGELSKLGVKVTIITRQDCLQPYLDAEIESQSIVSHCEYVEIVVSDTLRFFGVRGRSTSFGWWFSSLNEIFESQNFSVVQSFAITTSILNYQIFRIAKASNIPFCLQDHSSKSAFHPSPKGKLYIKFVRWMFVRKYNRYIARCYVPSPDIIDTVSNWYGVLPSLIHYEPLGVSEDWFHLPTEFEIGEAKELRKRLGVAEDKFVVLYTGRLTMIKGAPLLAEAIARINTLDKNVIGLFVGRGSEDEVSFIESQIGCTVIPMQNASDLPTYYWAADVGVWPRQGSTSILDAMACGLPAVVRSGLTEPERRPFEELIFEEDNLVDLQRVIMQLTSNPELKALGRASSEMILKNHTWKRIAQRRLEYYESLVSKRVFESNEGKHDN